MRLQKPRPENNNTKKADSLDSSEKIQCEPANLSDWSEKIQFEQAGDDKIFRETGEDHKILCTIDSGVAKSIAGNFESPRNKHSIIDEVDKETTSPDEISRIHREFPPPKGKISAASRPKDKEDVDKEAIGNYETSQLRPTRYHRESPPPKKNTTASSRPKNAKYPAELPGVQTARQKPFFSRWVVLLFTAVALGLLAIVWQKPYSFTALGPSECITLPSRLEPSGPVIAVMGSTGTGKSSFIRDLLGRNSTGCLPEIGHGLQSCTRNTTWYSATIDGQIFSILDTPGFDDIALSDSSILQELAMELASIYNDQKHLAGLIYLHDISKVKMGRVSKKNLLLFHRLVGTQSLENVVLTTTHWPLIPNKDTKNREEELKSSFWSEMIKYGSRVDRHNGKALSARRIVESLIKKTPIVPQITIELVEKGLRFDQTEAGKMIDEGLNALTSDAKLELSIINQQLKDAEQRRKRDLHKASQEQARLELDLQTLLKAAENQKTYQRKLEQEKEAAKLLAKEDREKLTAEFQRRAEIAAQQAAKDAIQREDVNKQLEALNQKFEVERSQNQQMREQLLKERKRQDRILDDAASSQDKLRKKLFEKSYTYSYADPKSYFDLKLLLYLCWALQSIAISVLCCNYNDLTEIRCFVACIEVLAWIVTTFSVFTHETSMPVRSVAGFHVGLRILERWGRIVAKDAYDKGSKGGFKDGSMSGYRDGLKDGVKDGLREGVWNGFMVGFKGGYVTGVRAERGRYSSNQIRYR
ncbi:hypothetical protein B0J11DRAFT_610906 [Dendryphion nanum]|uniref:G domain-containing protein n=1 Tax=Dendryphion nanum TaxID=256645 RepID=A0A9P9EM58_9PLEO|nr:hypothetical protein B0J11DRAFT_610906 [Dendryphion nanum]